MEIVYVNKGTGFSVVALPNISGFQRFNVFALNVCSFAKSIYNPNITISMMIKSFFSFSTREFCELRSVRRREEVNRTSKARFKRRTLHVPNLMQMSENNRFFSFALDSAHVKFDV